MAIISFTNYKRGQTRSSMNAVMRYTMQDKKNEWNGTQLVTGINCQPETVCDDFMLTKQLYHKTGGILFYHMVQSFPKGAEVDPVTAHAAAQKLAEYYAGHEVLICTHTDRDHIHSHFIINSVSFDTGKKLHIAKKQLQELRQRSDEVCREFSLPVFTPDPQRQKSSRMTIGEYHTAVRGQSKKLRLMNLINDCMRHAANREEFIDLMVRIGCQVRWEQSRRNITYTTPSGWRCRDKLLFGEKYLKERMEREFEIRTDILHGRAYGNEPTPADEAIHIGTDHTSDTTDRTAAHRDSMCCAGDDSDVGKASERAVRDAAPASDAGADGGAAERGASSGADDRTGWEAEREAFLSDWYQNTSSVPAAPVPRAASDSPVPAGLVGSVVQLGHALERSQSAGSVTDSTTTHAHADNKTLRMEKQKKIALGHKEDDHEEEQTWQQSI